LHHYLPFRYRRGKIEENNTDKIAFWGFNIRFALPSL
jgi:hypothetical protein